MQIYQDTLSVSQAAALCEVGRTTVGYWIRSKKLSANRRGKKYEIPVQNLLYFLKQNGQEIPAQLQKENSYAPVFRSFQNCWSYYQDHPHGTDCRLCIVFKNKLPVCFSARHGGTLNCRVGCASCRYYRDVYYARLQFIHQFDLPAAIIKDLYFWAGNPEMASLCEIPEKDLVGMGIEKIIHPRSLEKVISWVKRKTLGDPGLQSECSIYIKNRHPDGLKIKCSVFMLKEPLGTFLITAAGKLNAQPASLGQAFGTS